MPTLHVTRDAEQLCIFREGLERPLLTQVAKPGMRPYIHPILAPDGDGELTENQPGHHLWQHGLYVGLNKVSGFGFWTEGLSGDAHDGSFDPAPLATPICDAAGVAWQVVTGYHAPDDTKLLTETQRWYFTDLGDSLQLDVDWELRAVVPLTFGQYAYGGLFLRMPWRHETHGDLLTSEGATLQDAAEAQRARWVAIAMPIPSRAASLSSPAGFAFFDHPTNPEFPNPWRVDNGLGIVPSRCIAGEWHLAAGASSTNRYRLLAFTGAIDGPWIEREWRRFAED